MTRTKALLHVEMDLENIAYAVTDVHDNDAVTSFILKIDDIMADYNFSVELLRRLADTMKEDGVDVTITEKEYDTSDD
jgi:hypothetical protein